MQIRPEQLAARLARGLDALYTVHGDEPLLHQEACDAIRAAARAAGFGERKVFVASGGHVDWSSVLAAAQALSLFAERQLIEIQIPGGKPGKDGSEALQRYCERLAPDVLTLVSLPRLDGMQTRSAWFGALERAGCCVRVEPVARQALPGWIGERLARQGQRVRPGEEGQRTLAFFADRVEGNLLAAQQEVTKLGLLHPPGELSFDAVREAVMGAARYDVFKLGEAVLAGQVERALRMLDGLKAEGEAAVLVHWTLAADLQALSRIRGALDQGTPLPLALQAARVWGARERLLERVVPLLSGSTVAHLVQAASICDGLVKGLRHPDWPADPWEALRRLVLMTVEAIAGMPSRRAGTRLLLMP